MVVLGAAIWIAFPDIAGYVFAAGTLLFAFGRLAGPDSDWRQVKRNDDSYVLRRLYRQRIAAIVILAIAAVFINLPAGFYMGFYIRRSFWLLPFIVFVVFEAYTAFRIPAIEKKNADRR